MISATAGEGWPSDAEAFHARLAGGVLPAVTRRRPSAWKDEDGERHLQEVARRDRAVLHDDGRLWELVRPLDDVRRTPFLTVEQVSAQIADLATHLRQHRESLLAVLFSPHELFEVILRRIGDSGADVVEVWLRLCWITEAAWSCAQPGFDGGALVAGDQALLLPLVARARFLVLSEPMRHSREPASSWAVNERTILYRARAFGATSWHVLLGSCRQARWRWQQVLSEFESHPLLAQASPSELEAEVATLVFARAGIPLLLAETDTGEPAIASADDLALMTDAIDTHLLPRFNLHAVIQLASDGPDRVVRRMTSTVVLAAAIGSVVLAGFGHFTVAAWMGATCYLLLAFGVVRAGRLWAAQWLLRLPAAAAVGLLVLVSLPPAWWQQARVGWAPGVLAGAASGYLIVEARNHGVAPLAAVGRALGVAAIGAAHALLVCLVGLVLVAPSYVENGDELARLWREDALVRPWAVLMLSAAWCLAVGVFSQILWDDRPITAPLAHLQWRRGR